MCLVIVTIKFQPNGGKFSVKGVSMRTSDGIVYIGPRSSFALKFKIEIVGGGSRVEVIASLRTCFLLRER